MRIKRFVAENMNEALGAVKAELGPEAVILCTRQGKRGLFGPSRVEVVAAAPRKPEQRPKRPEEAGDLDIKVREASGALSRLRERLEVNDEQLVLPQKRRIICLVGPTGVGKTTTVAKIAARGVLEEGLSTALITIDTYRIGAVDQLKMYGEILDVPVRATCSPLELKQAITELQDRELILIDTAGQNPRNRMQVNKLRGYLGSIRGIEVHLVMSLPTRDSDLEYIFAAYRCINPSYLILTKVDETSSRSGLVTLPERLGCPISYLGVGQDVPEDLLIPDAGIIEDLTRRGGLNERSGLRA